MNVEFAFILVFFYFLIILEYTHEKKFSLRSQYHHFEYKLYSNDFGKHRLYNYFISPNLKERIVNLHKTMTVEIKLENNIINLTVDNKEEIFHPFVDLEG